MYAELGNGLCFPDTFSRMQMTQLAQYNMIKNLRIVLLRFRRQHDNCIYHVEAIACRSADDHFNKSSQGFFFVLFFSVRIYKGASS